MLHTFRAILRGDSLEWGEEVRGLLRRDRPMQGQCMAAALEKLAQTQAFAGIEPVDWQHEVRQERELPGRNE